MSSTSLSKFSRVLLLAAGTTIACSDSMTPVPTYDLSLINGPLPHAEQGVPYADFHLLGSRGTAPYLFTTDEAPAGMTVTADGRVTGTPTLPAGDVGVIGVHFVGSEDPDQLHLGRAELPITVVPRLHATSAALPQGHQNSPYTATVTSTGGDGTPVWTVMHGSLPPGLGLSAGGTIAGTPTAAGSSTAELLVTDALGVVDSIAVTIDITPRLVVPLITTASVSDAEVGVPYSHLVATGGTLPYVWDLSAGALPTPMTISSAGVISGAPAAAGSASFTARVTDAGSATDTKGLTLTVQPAISITTLSVPAGTQSVAYTTTPLAASGGVGPYTWTISNGALPTGVNLSSGGVISGTPGPSGPFNFTAQVQDAAGGIATQDLTMLVAAAPPMVATTSMPDAEVGVLYGVTVTATGGVAPYSWDITTGALPGPMNLSTVGVISGTPVTSGSTSFTLRVTDQASATATKDLVFLVQPAVSITSTTVLDASQGVPFNATLVATGGIGAYSWTITSGALPGPMSLSAGGVISGTPAAAGTFNFTVQVQDAVGGTASLPFSLVVTVPVVTITTTSPLPGTDVGLAYGVPLVATGGTPPYRWTVVSGTLPTSIVPFFGELFASQVGAPAGDYTFTLQVKDAALNIATQAFLLPVRLQPSFVTTTLPDGQVGVPYSQTLIGQDGFPPLMFVIGFGGLPDGLGLSSSGVIAGTPTTAQTVSNAIKVFDGVGGFGYENFTITIDP